MMFEGEWVSEKTEFLSVKESKKYRDAIITLAFPWLDLAPNTSEPFPPTDLSPIQLRVVGTIRSLIMRCLHSCNGGAPEGKAERVTAIANLWLPSLYHVMATDLPESLIPHNCKTEQSLIRGRNNSAQAFLTNGICLSYIPSCDKRQEDCHQLSLFYFFRVRYLLEKWLLRVFPRLIAMATSTVDHSCNLIPSLSHKSIKLRKLLHHCLYTSLVLSRPGATGSRPLGAIMASDREATAAVMEGQPLAIRQVMTIHIAEGDNLSVRKAVTPDLELTIAAPGQSFPFAVGKIGDALCAATLNICKNPRPEHQKRDYYFGEELAFYSQNRVGYSLSSLSGEVNGLAFAPFHTVADGLWELYWPAYASFAYRADKAFGGWVVPEAICETEVLAAGHDIFKDSEKDEDTDVLSKILEQSKGTTMPKTMDEALLFALCESLRNLNRRHRLSGPFNGPLKVSIISLMGEYLKRHSPRIPHELRSQELSDPQVPKESKAGKADDCKPAVDETNEEHSDGEGEQKMTKEQKFLKFKAEKDAKNSAKGKKTDKKKAQGGETTTTAPSSQLTDAQNSHFAIHLHPKNSSFKKLTVLLSEMAERSNGAYFTMENENEILVHKDIKKLNGSAVTFDIVGYHKRQYKDFLKSVHRPLIEYEKVLNAENDLAASNGHADDDDDDIDKLSAGDNFTKVKVVELYSLGENVSQELSNIVTGKRQVNAATPGDEDESDSDFVDIQMVEPDIKELVDNNIRSPVVLQPFSGPNGVSLYRKADLLGNLKHYVVTRDLYYPPARVQNQRQANNRRGPQAPPTPMVHLDALLRDCLQITNDRWEKDLLTFFDVFVDKMLGLHTRIEASNPTNAKVIWKVGSLDKILVRKRMKQMYVVGLDDFELSHRALTAILRKELSAAVTCTVTPPKLNRGSRPCLLATATENNVLARLKAIGIPDKFITSNIGPRQ